MVNAVARRILRLAPGGQFPTLHTRIAAEAEVRIFAALTWQHAHTPPFQGRHLFPCGGAIRQLPHFPMCRSAEHRPIHLCASYFLRELRRTFYELKQHGFAWFSRS